MMALNCATMFVRFGLSNFRTPTVCLASSSAGITNTEQLRQQLDHLHKEAENTRAKASNARLRLMRLSEAAENLQRQALNSVRTGKENNAWELLHQKKKVMEAMEKSKNRIELLDELSAKLNEAISVKEGQLIGNVAIDLEVVNKEAPNPVRIVSPVEETPNHFDTDEELNSGSVESEQPAESRDVSESPGVLPAENEWDNNEESISGKTWSEGDYFQGLRDVSSYEDFMQRVDQQLKRIEVELETFLRLSNLLLENEERVENSRVQHAKEVHEAVCIIRQRIASIIATNVESAEGPN